MRYLVRLLFCIVLWFAVPVLPWPVLFGAIVFAVASWEWFFEAAILGLIFDAVSGLPLGFCVLLFTALVIFVEGVKSYLRSDARLEMLWVVAIAAALFGILELIFWGALFGRDILSSGVFYWDLAADWLMLAITAGVFLAIRTLMGRIHPVKSGLNLTG